MDADELPVIEPDVDYTQILPLQQKRRIAFINNFIMNTVSFLNTFCNSCESRLMEFEYKLQKVDASLLILESQLSSIPSLDSKKEASPVEEKATEDNLDLPEVVPTAEKQEKQVTEDAAPRSSNAGPKACEDPRFIRFFKMVQFGVPVAAVRLKMETEGLDPTVLDKPNDVIPGFSTEQPRPISPSSNST